MAYCPQCSIEYDDEVEECIECGGPLVEGSAEEMFPEIGEHEWVELDPLPALSYAKMVKDVLDEEGISCYIRSYFTSGGGTYYDNQATILVPEQFYDNALEMQQGMAPPDDEQFMIDPDADDF